MNYNYEERTDKSPINLRSVVIDKPENRGFKFGVKGGITSIKTENEQYVLETQSGKKLVNRSVLTIISKSDALKVAIPIYRGYWKPLKGKHWDVSGQSHEQVVGMTFVNQLGIEIKVIFDE